MAMVTLVVYDIGENAQRREVEKICKDYGLNRVQASVFRGKIDSKHRESLVYTLTLQSVKAGEGTWDVQVYFISKDDFESHVRLEGGGLKHDSIDDQEVVII